MYNTKTLHMNILPSPIFVKLQVLKPGEDGGVQVCNQHGGEGVVVAVTHLA